MHKLVCVVFFISYIFKHHRLVVNYIHLFINNEDIGGGGGQFFKDVLRKQLGNNLDTVYMLQNEQKYGSTY